VLIAPHHNRPPQLAEQALVSPDAALGEVDVWTW
jgi:hypothetical protein